MENVRLQCQKFAYTRARMLLMWHSEMHRVTDARGYRRIVVMTIRIFVVLISTLFVSILSRASQSCGATSTLLPFDCGDKAVLWPFGIGGVQRSLDKEML